MQMWADISVYITCKARVTEAIIQYSMVGYPVMPTGLSRISYEMNIGPFQTSLSIEQGICLIEVRWAWDRAQRTW